MIDARKVRPVSGEIMTDRPDQRRAAASGDDVVDAEYVTIPASPAGEASVEPPRAAARAADLTGMQSLKRGAPMATPAGRRGGPLFWAGGCTLALAAFWIAGGHTLSDAIFAAPAAAVEMRIVELTSRVEDAGAGSLVMVDGKVAHGASAPQRAPRLAIDVRGDDGGATRYILDPGGAIIGAGELFPFSSRVVAPSGGVAGVSVSVLKGDS